jgi:hypothetical protein
MWLITFKSLQDGREHTQSFSDYYDAVSYAKEMGYEIVDFMLSTNSYDEQVSALRKHLNME